MQKASKFTTVLLRTLALLLCLAALYSAWINYLPITSLREHWLRSGFGMHEFKKLGELCAGSGKETQACRSATEQVLRFLNLPIKIEELPTHSLLDLEPLVSSAPDRPLLVALAINAWMAEYDPHSGLLPKSYVQEMERFGKREENNRGLGLNFRKLRELCVLTTVLPNSAAARAGLQAGDELLKIENKECLRMTGFQGSETLRELAKRQHSVQLTVLRDKPFTVLLVPEPLPLNSVLWKMQNDYAYIQLQNFYQTETCEQLKNALLAIKERNAKGIILDLRNNPGGYIEEAGCIAGLFLGDNATVANFETAIDQQLTAMAATVLAAPLEVKFAPHSKSFALLSTQMQATALPLVAMVNHATASSAEILAGALQDYRRAVLVGQRSFGKGTMQTSVLLPSNPSIQYTQTTHRIRLPSGQELQRYGVLPLLALPEPERPVLPREALLFSQATRAQEPLVQRVLQRKDIELQRCVKKRSAASTDIQVLAKNTLDCLTQGIRLGFSLAK